MPLYFEIDENTLGYSIEAVPSTESLGLDQHGLFKKIIEETGRTREHYDKVLARYGRLIGQGRITLLELLDQLFIDLLLLYANLKPGDTKESRESQRKTDLKVMFENRNKKYLASGFVEINHLSLENDFGNVYEVQVLDNMKNLLVSILYSLITIRYNMVKCTIDC